MKKQTIMLGMLLVGAGVFRGQYPLQALPPDADEKQSAPPTEAGDILLHDQVSPSASRSSSGKVLGEAQHKSDVEILTGFNSGAQARGDEKLENHIDAIERQLNLTNEQQEMLKRHRSAHREQAQILRNDLRQKKKLLSEELEKPELNMAQATKIHEEIKQIQAKLADHRFEGIVEVRKILTPEQFKKFHELKTAQWKNKPGFVEDGKEKKGKKKQRP